MQNKLKETDLRKLARELADAARRGPVDQKKHADGGGLFLQATPKGKLIWRLKYRHAGKEGMLTFGEYPHVTCEEARAKRDAAKAEINAGRNPAEAKREAKAAALAAPGPEPEAPTFGNVARELLAELEAALHPDTHYKWKLQLGYAIAKFDARQLAEITGAELFAFLKGWQAEGNRKPHTLHSIRRKMNDVFERGRFLGMCPGNPMPPAKMFLAANDTSRPARLEPEAFGEMLRTIDAAPRLLPATRAALLFLALTFQRPHMVRLMTWEEIDWQAKRWNVPARDMKGRVTQKRDHIVPLSEPALDVLRSMLPFAEEGRPVFPPRFGAALSKKTMSGALDDLGIYDHVPHGFRASANTIIKEHLAKTLAAELPTGTLSLQELIDRQLAHVIGNETQRAYDRTAHLAERAVIMRVWGEFIEGERRKGRKLELAA